MHVGAVCVHECSELEFHLSPGVELLSDDVVCVFMNAVSWSFT